MEQEMLNTDTLNLETLNQETLNQEALNSALLILVVSPKLEEVIVDLLLEQPALSGFTSSHVSAHGTTNSKLSLKEQVTGRQQKVQFMVYGDFTALQNLINTLKTTFANSGLRTILLSAIASEVI